MNAARWLHAFDIVFGLIAVILSVVVLTYQELAILTMIFVLSIGLQVIGNARIISGILAKHFPDGIRTFNFGMGLVMSSLAVVALVYVDLTTQVLIYILSFILLLNGVARLVIGGFARTLPKWLRRFLVDVGVITIALSVVVFMAPSFGLLTLVLILSITFLFNGVARIVQGIKGTQKTHL